MSKKLAAKISLPNKARKQNSKNGRGRRKRNRGQGATGKGAPRGEMAASTANTGIVVRNIPLFAYRTKRTLQYYTAGTIVTTASAANSYVLSCNGLFDPDITGTGGQPMGFDQMMLFYNHYTVVRSRCRAVITNGNSNILPNACVLLSGRSKVNTSIEDLIENGDLVMAPLSYTGAMGGSSKLVRACDCAKFQGIDDIMDDPNMRGDSASNPTEQMYFHLSAWNPYSASVATVFFQVIIEYETIFHEPRKGPLS
jgi:hypothetical protein